MSKIILGIVADDFSGASDAASFLVEQGIKTILFNGIPENEMDFEENDLAVVIALKTRTEETKLAVDESIRAFSWLTANGANQLYSKYCSTFDSTPEGNIGPIIDKYLEKSNQQYTIVAPALPINKRIVKDGHLIVDGIPLHETHMKDHPLTPMWDSRLKELMHSQGKYESFEIDHKMLQQSDEEIMQAIDEFGKDREHFYIIPDLINEESAERIIQLFGELPFLTGGSGLMTALGKKIRKGISKSDIISSSTQGKAIVLAGSCSKATLQQIKAFQESGGKSIKIDPLKLIDGTQSKEEIWKEIEKTEETSILVYSSDEPENVKKAQKAGIIKVSKMLEESTAYIAQKAVENDFNSVIVAGGETSGAVTQTLGNYSYLVGESIAPGVPVMIPLNNLDLRLILKSGNFGQEDFFLRAINFTRGDTYGE